MSIKRMTDVWDKSTHTSSDLLLLLALADMANEDGHCWPGIETLCKKTRLSESTVIRRTRAIEKSGELIVKRNRRHGNKYLVVTGFTPEQIEALIMQYFGEKFLTVKLQDKSNLQNDSSELASYDSSELAPVTDDPSLTVIDPSKDSPEEKTPPAALVEESKPQSPTLFTVVLKANYGIDYVPKMDLQKKIRSYVNGVVSVLAASCVQPPIAPEELQRFVADIPAQFLPRDPGGWLAGVNRWRNEHKTATLSTATNTNGMSIGGSLPIVRAPAEVCA